MADTDFQTVKVINLGEGSSKPVLRLPFNGIPGAFIILSFKPRQVSEAHIGYHIKYPKPYFNQEPMMSFFFAGEKCGAEWVPTDGPIMIYTRCKPDWTGKSYGGHELKAKEHWYYDWVEDNAGAWSQMAVENERLPHKLHAGDFVGIFHSLKQWANRDEE